jgi:hypothetical protein
MKYNLIIRWQRGSRRGFIPAGNGDGEEMSLASGYEDPRKEIFSSRGWGAKIRHEIAHCHP